MSSALATERLLAVMNAADGYRSIQVGHDRLQFARTFRPTWAQVVGWTLTPVLVGFVVLMARTTETCTVVVESDHRGTRLRLQGRLRSDVVGALRAAVSGGTSAAPVLGAPVAVASEAPHGLVFTPLPTDGLISSAPSGVITPTPTGPAPVVAAPMVDGIPAQLAGFHAPAPAPAAAEDAWWLAGPPPGSVPVAAPAPAPASVAAPAPAPAPAPVAISAAVPVTLPEPEPVVSLVAPAASDWVLSFDDGRHVDFSVFGRVLVGRQPVATADDGNAGVVEVVDPDMSVSKTHLALAANELGVWVIDRGSTNGTWLVLPDGSSVAVPTQEGLLVPAGSEVRFGARSLRVGARVMELQA